MIFGIDRIRNVLRVGASLMLVASLLSPMPQAAAATKSTAKEKKTLVAKKADRKKVAAKIKTGSRQLAKAPGKSPTRQKVAKQGRKAVVAQKDSRQQVKSSRKERDRELTRVAKSRTGRSLAATAAPTVMRVAVPPAQSMGDRLGLREGGGDHLALNSSVALVVDQDTNEVLFSKNDGAVLPIASLTKLMTGLVIADANLSMEELITITDDDVDVYKGSRSRLSVGTTLTRGELMHLSLMSSENRAAHALGRTFPGGMQHFVKLMNSKARELGMFDTRYVEPTGLLSQNQSSARDLATLVSVAYQRPILRDLSTSPSHQLALGNRVLQFNNSNRLVRSPDWEIGLQKTGYISEAGRCLVMQAKVAGRKLIMVFLDSSGKLARVQDAERVRRWVEAEALMGASGRPQG